MKTKSITLGIALFFLSFSITLSQTYISGSISASDTWVQSNNPYIIGNTIIEAGVTITIEPGVELQFEQDKAIIINGSLYAIGNETDSISFTKNTSSNWGRLWFKTGSVGELKYCSIEYGGDPTILVETGTSFEIMYCNVSNNNGCAIYTNDFCTISHNTISNNISTDRGGGIRAVGNPNITNNIIYNNTAWEGAGIHSAGSALIDSNIVYQNATSSAGGGGIYCENGDPIVSNNIVYDNISLYDGGGIMCTNNGTIINNTVYGNSATNRGGGLRFGNGDYLVSNNYIYDNTAGSGSSIYTDDGYTFEIYCNTIIDSSLEPIVIWRHQNNADIYIRNNDLLISSPGLYYESPFNILADSNYWGTTVPAEIEEIIYDFNEDFNFGIVSYMPYLNSNSSCAGIITEVSQTANKYNQLKLYPNPVINTLYIDIETPIEKIQIFDITGKQQLIVSSVKEIDMSRLQAGIYLLMVKTKGDVFARKIIKK